MTEFEKFVRKNGVTGMTDVTCTKEGCRWRNGKGRFCFNVTKINAGNRDKDPQSWEQLYECPNLRYTETLQVMAEDKVIDLVTVTITNAEIGTVNFEEHRATVNALRQKKTAEWGNDPANLAEAEAKLVGHKSLLHYPD